MPAPTRRDWLARRTFLRGVGVSMALPWMESRNVWAGDGGAAGAAGPPTRLAVLFSGNGFHAKEWWARGEGEGMELGQVLEPLAPAVATNPATSHERP